ncbi:Succinate-semialdehyde dehydrogenase [NADP(+)] GabD [Leucobacter aridicollis]|uniref:Succinate-semialdehyde dehydrogenase/glutarate-semialdehyde dehydrogenase n=1 Tax=Leucobacter aridicollis TaxID=283878 RepID=A0A852QYY9_9MICO|nr:aldehyde dehydrogenase family protein [Leucobacter aridicollis]MBL3683818.1 aldehyde dehydrogenase [Leucobacter aridicollis]NYD26571.1 succinate-semialdehyde dehydrogenase/glutarate-semialdehyde dehydrogenase [Leucobacter aridicollis]RKQ84047.1 succinate-semialdehyde dehydrogenase/glutarate-semialdehyde dehydrogenase [Mycolicibacterium mucogenicum 261Sha1.1M5]
MSSLPVPTRTQLFIAGEFTDGASTERADIFSPSTGEKIASIPVPTTADLDLAVAKAHEAKTAWRKLGVFARAEICHKVGTALESRVEELARLQSLEQGKPYEESLSDVKEAAQLFHLHAEDAVRLYGETLPSNDIQKRQITQRAPIGVFGIITPWNFPLLMFAEFVAPGLATGNAHVVKPPTNTPLTVLAAMDALLEAGVPDGLVSVLPGEGEFGAALVSHPGIDAVGFIGSSATATKIQATAGLKPLLIEASGNGPVVVLADANIERAAKAAVDGAFYCAGQVCCATERVIVHKDVHEEFVAAVLEYSKTVVLGDPFDPNTNLGPLNNEGVAAKMDRHMEDARERGLDILLGGGRREGQPTDLYYEFTVVDNVTTDSLLSREESFGPVLPIIVAEDDDDALRIANDDPLGLQGAVFTENLSKAFRFMEEMETGQVVVNDSNGWWDVNMPFGGAGGKGTGWGRIGGMYTLHDMTYLRTGVIHIGA